MERQRQPRQTNQTKSWWKVKPKDENQSELF